MTSLRWYQEQAVSAVWDYLRTQDGAPCVVLPTGSGKTHVIAELCRQVVAWGGRAIVLAHVKELLEQTADKLTRFVDPSIVGIYSAGLKERTTATPIVVAGIQSVYQRAEELGAFHLIVVDEAHLIPPNGSGRYRFFLEAEKKISPKARLVGLTATPYRLGCGWIVKDKASSDDDAYDRLLDTIVYEAPICELISDGTLSKVVSKEARRSPDFSGVHTTRGDFDEQEVEKVFAKKNALESACLEIVEKTKERRKTIVFCNRVESARRCAKLLEEYDPDHEALVVDGETSSNERAEIVRRFKSEVGDADLFGNVGKPLKYVCNCGVFTTGFDAPNVDCVALLRPTKSLALYQQMVGRGLRRAPEKFDCLVLDFGGNVDRHGPIDLADPEPTYGDANKPWKKCRECGAIVKKEFAVCPLCGAEFSVPRGATDPNANLSGSASTSSVLSTDEEPSEPKVEEYAVTAVEYEPHWKKDAPPDKPPTLQVKYLRGQFSRPWFEWLCPGHPVYKARSRFESWWKSKSKVDPPQDAETAALYANAGALAKPTRIQVTTQKGERFPKIKWIEFGKIPDFDPSTVKTREEQDEEFWDDFAVFDPDSQSRGCEAPDGDAKVDASTTATPSGNLHLRLNCRQCRHWSFDELDDSRGFCSLYGKTADELSDEVGPDVCFEEPWPEEDLP
ncbi:MAG: DEAD/DEAH box helicase, partial [Thermoguttaceae bacterium]|nr:DEAD/DEAH box helicase [Thermoguttaceae bacterium]